MTDDQDLMAALFVSEDGEIASFVEDVTPEDDWVDRMDGTSAVRFYRLSVPERLSVPKPVVAGILRLIRERDEARELAEQYGGLSEVWPWEIKP